MKEVFTIADNIYTPIGKTSGDNFKQLINGVSGIKKHTGSAISEMPFLAALFDKSENFCSNGNEKSYTKFEKLIIASITNALQQCPVNITDEKTILIISSTKGNISLLETEKQSDDLVKRIALSTSAKLIAAHFNLVNQPVIISNACISGSLSILAGMRMLQSGAYENAIVAGADIISKFILSGFQSFQAISDEQCRPFDADRKGINLGEGAATVILSTNKKNSQGIKVAGGAISNDANHISGPSRTGEELGIAISKTLKQAGLTSDKIDFISAHGTATVYNDEMESKAIGLAQLQNVPVNSLKGYYGHTLGAAGVIEAVASINSLKENIVLPTFGYNKIGVSVPVNVCDTLYKTPLQNCLKTASGFGGCNAALIFSKQ